MRHAWLFLIMGVDWKVVGLDGLERNNSLCLKQRLDKARKRVTEKVKIYAGLDKSNR